MTQEEILKYNERCIKFLGYKYKNPTKYWVRYPLNDNSTLGQLGFVSKDRLKFHSDWNWIMEVKKAIENYQPKGHDIKPYTIKMWGNRCSIEIHPQYALATCSNELPMFDLFYEDVDLKGSMVQAINEFLTWCDGIKVS